MKIVHFLHGFRPEFTGGVERYVESLALAQKRSLGYDVHVVAGSGKSAEKPGLQELVVDGIPVTKILRSDLFRDEWFDAYSPSVERSVEDLLGRLRPDLVHVHHWKRLTSNLVQIAARSGFPAVLTLHDLWSTCPREYRLLGNESCARPLGAESCARCARLHFFQSVEEVGAQADVFRALVLRELETAGAVLAPSGHHAAALASHLGFPLDRLTVLPLGRLGTDPLEVQSAAASRGPESPIRVGFWGHLLDFKGPHLLLEALAHVRSSDRFEVHLFGTEVAGTYRARLDRLAEGKRVQFHGSFRPPDVAATPLDVAVIPSICHESYSFVLEEAFCLGLPVIVSDRGALPERAGAAGLVFRAADSRSLAEKLQSLIDDHGLLDRLRGAIPRDDRSSELHARAVAEVYKRVRARGLPALPATSEHRDLAVQLAADGDRRIRLLIAMREKAERADHYEGNLLRHREMLKERDREIASYRKVLDEVRNELEDHRKVLAARERECGELREVVAALRSDLDGHRAVLAERERECRDRRQIQENQAQEIDALREIVAARERQLEEHRVAFDALKRDLEGHRAVLAERENRLAEALQVIRAIESDLEGHRRALSDRDSALATRDGEILHLREEVAAQSARLDDLRATLDEIERTFAFRVARKLTGVGQRRSGDGARKGR